MIVDCHCHAGLGDGLSGPWDTEARLDRYLTRAAAAGIDRTVLFAAFHSDYAVANRAVARIVDTQPDRFFGFAFVHAARDAGRVDALVREAVEWHGFVGINVHRYDARITREVCEVARAYALPVLYDVMGEVSVVELVGFANSSGVSPHGQLARFSALGVVGEEAAWSGRSCISPCGTCSRSSGCWLGRVAQRNSRSWSCATRSRCFVGKLGSRGRRGLIGRCWQR
jgi:hypothetical protein